MTEEKPLNTQNLSYSNDVSDIIVLSQTDIRESLETRVFNQFQAVRLLSRIGHEQLRRLDKFRSTGRIQRKHNVILTGDTGVGKTFIAQTLAEELGLPYHVFDATDLSESGYVGGNASDFVMPLISAADNNVGLAQWGVVVIEEIDKIARTKDYGSKISDVDVQREFLKIVEGKKIIVGKTGVKEGIVFDTTNVLFIGTGSFQGEDYQSSLQRIIDERTGYNRRQIGFDIDSQESDVKRVTHPIPQDLQKFGFIPEFVGRFSNICRLNQLTPNDLHDILAYAPASPLTYLIENFRDMGIDLGFTKRAIYYLSEFAHDLGVGARGLDTVIESLKDPLGIYQDNRYAGRRISVSEEVVKDILGGKYHHENLVLENYPTAKITTIRYRINSDCIRSKREK